MVDWRCGCGCGEEHRLYVGTHQEALDLVVEVQREQAPKEIRVFRWYLPRRKDSILLALNDASGLEVEADGEIEELAHYVREDRPGGGPPAAADGGAGGAMFH